MLEMEDQGAVKIIGCAMKWNINNQEFAHVITPHPCHGLARSRSLGPDGPLAAPDSYRCFSKER
jgi:hypothetical protein